ncbi:hypothetical protein [Natronorubrum sulfidifaciens]|uniref:Uncharacterized protein n=1 Tax=Natronorubrum sulfidifaciens JCM 14089 TaxID=1230460 RepID=L9WCQ2_9EURY|nr:hypothetical protein [Natronorubrum sulfidifaciens]ELY46088.1 hypothetical protein C495_07595 [Natronorubrum sulfidifaciens JCM 14089]
MSTEPTDAFPEIDPDPDAVLAAFGIDSPDDLAAAGGAHEPTRDDRIDADDTTAAELFADVQLVETATQPIPATDGGDPSPGDDADEPTAQADENLEFEFVGDAAVTVRDGDVIDATAADLRTVTGADSSPATDSDARRPTRVSTEPDGEQPDADAAGTSRRVTDTTTDLTLVGPEPTPTRVANDRFNSAGADGQSPG